MALYWGGLKKYIYLNGAFRNNSQAPPQNKATRGTAASSGIKKLSAILGMLPVPQPQCFITVKKQRLPGRQLDCVATKVQGPPGQEGADLAVTAASSQVIQLLPCITAGPYPGSQLSHSY